MGRKTFKSILLSIVAIGAGNAFASISRCYVQGSDFYVISDGSRYRQSIDNYSGSIFDCTNSFAAVYDGDDFYVFSDATRNFQRQGVDDAYEGSGISAGDVGVLLYDGDDIYAFNGSGFSRSASVDDNAVANASSDGIAVNDLFFYLDRSGQLQRTSSTRRPDSTATCYVDGSNFYVKIQGQTYRQSVDEFAESRFRCNAKYAAIYDGDDFYVFDVAIRSFQRVGADDGYASAAVAVSSNGAELYDGDDVYGYSNGGGFVREGSVDDNAVGTVSAGAIVVGDYEYILNPSGTIDRVRN